MTNRVSNTQSTMISATAQNAAALDPRLKAFIQPENASDIHIVDTLIEERCPTLSAHWTWPLIRTPLFSALKYKRAKVMADEIAQLATGENCFDYLVDILDLKTTVSGLENIPTSGRVVIVSNHPTGLADGGAIWSMLTQVRRDIEILANADACRVNPAFADVIIPVEWVEDKRTPAKTRETLRRAGAAFRAERCLVIFPSGRLALKENGQLVDRDWFPTAVTLARKNKATIIPVNMQAKNSELFYALSKVSRELKDITLFRELLNKGRTPFKITIGTPIPSERLEGDAAAITTELKRHIEHEIPLNPEKLF